MENYTPTNNKLRITFEEYKEYARQNKKTALTVFCISAVVTMFLTSWFMQAFYSLTERLDRTHLFNPVYIVYYGILAPDSFLLWLVLTVVVSAAVLYYKVYMDLRDEEYDERGFVKANTGTYGTADIMGKREKQQLLETTTLEESDENIVGANGDGTIDVIKGGYNNREIGPFKLLVGSSGTGKTSGCILPDMYQSMRRGESIVCTDTKGGIRSETRNMALSFGYKEENIKEFNLVNPLVSDSCDFMSIVRTFQDAQDLANIIVANTEGDGKTHEDYWTKGERTLITFGILYVHEAKEFEGKRTLRTVTEVLIDDMSDGGKKMDGKVKALPESSQAKMAWKIFMTTPESAIGGIITGVGLRLVSFNDNIIANLTGVPDIDFTLPAKEKCVYYVIISDQNPTYRFLSAMFFSCLFSQIIRFADYRYDEKVIVPVNFIMDELLNIGVLSNLDAEIRTIRSRGVRMTMSIQDLGGLQTVYPDGADSILSNCDEQVLLGTNDAKITAKYYSERTGTMTIKQHTEREQMNRFLPYSFRSDYASSVGEGKRDAVFLPDEIISMDNNYQLVFFKGHNVLKTMKPYYFKCPLIMERVKKESYIYHVPKWWSVVEERAKKDSSYDISWLKNELENLNKYKAEIAAEKAEEDKKKAEEKQKEKDSKRMPYSAARRKDDEKDAYYFEQDPEKRKDEDEEMVYASSGLDSADSFGSVLFREENQKKTSGHKNREEKAAQEEKKPEKSHEDVDKGSGSDNRKTPEREGRGQSRTVDSSDHMNRDASGKKPADHSDNSPAAGQNHKEHERHEDDIHIKSSNAEDVLERFGKIMKRNEEINKRKRGTKKKKTSGL